MTDHAAEAKAALQRRGVTEPATIGLVLGTGLGPVADLLEEPIAVPYGELPGFPHSAVSGHAGRLVVGTCEGVRIVILQGRTHYYETGDARAMAVPLATLKALGVQTVMLTNSAGSTNLDWHPGTLVLISDHIAFAGLNPLIGETSDTRFVNMTEAYDKRLRARLRRSAPAAGINALREGVYMWFSGPSFETPAEVRMAKMLGADLVGMSTVPEVLLARHLGLKVAALSLVTNFATGVNQGNPTHAETKDVALAGSIAVKRLVRAFLRDDGSGLV